MYCSRNFLHFAHISQNPEPISVLPPSSSFCLQCLGGLLGGVGRGGFSWLGARGWAHQPWRGRGGGCAVPRHPGTRWLNAGFSALPSSAVSLPSPQLCPPVSLGSVGIFQSPQWPLSHLNTAFWQVPASSPRKIHRSPPSPGFPPSASPWRSPVLGGRSPGPVPASPPPQTSLHSRPRPGPRVHLAELNPPLLGLPLPKASSGGRGTERAPRPGVAGWPVASQTGSGRVHVHRQASLQTPRLNVMQFSRVTKMSPFDSFQPFKNQTSLAHT